MSSPIHLEGKTLTFILAGGEGERLYPLTADQPKPMVPFGGVFRTSRHAKSGCRLFRQAHGSMQTLSWRL